METEVKRFDQLTTEELYEILRLRAEVFIVEQNCVYQDLDGKDHKAIHVLGRINQELVAYARLFGASEYFKEASIGRIVVSPKHRTLGLGKQIVKASEEALDRAFKAQRIKLSAQSYLGKFYKELGYKSYGEEYLEDGIPHIAMVKDGRRK